MCVCVCVCVRACAHSFQDGQLSLEEHLCHWNEEQLFLPHGVQNYDLILLANNCTNWSGSENRRIKDRELGGMDTRGISPSLLMYDQSLNLSDLFF